MWSTDLQIKTTLYFCNYFHLLNAYLTSFCDISKHQYFQPAVSTASNNKKKPVLLGRACSPGTRLPLIGCWRVLQQLTTNHYSIQSTISNISVTIYYISLSITHESRPQVLNQLSSHWEGKGLAADWCCNGATENAGGENPACRGWKCGSGKTGMV